MSHANIVIEVYCLLITTILLICNDLAAKRKKENRKSTIMTGMLLANGFIICAFVIQIMVDGNIAYAWLNNGMTGICYAMGAIMTELFGEYVFSIMKETRPASKRFMFTLRIVCSIAVVLDLSSIFSGIYFSTVNGYHIRGPYFLFNQILILLVMLLELLYVIVHRKTIGKDATALIMYSVLPLISIVLQIFIKDYVLMYPAITLSLFIIYVVTFINQAELLHQKNQELELAIQETEQSKKEAEKANRAKSEFLSSMSHDIRTPLNAIIGMTEMAVDNIDNRKQALEDLDIVQSSSRHLLSLVNDVLDLSLIESGKMSIAQNPFILPDLLNEVERIAWPLCKAKKQQFNVVADHVSDEFYIGDMPRLKQILVNFISNAVKYTATGGTVTVKIEEENSEQADTAMLKFTCIDNGIGIEEERQREIFEPFVREVKSTVNPIEGTGLGLTIVRNIVDAMHGKLELVSEKGQGSTFTAVIPLHLADEAKMLAPFEDVKNNQVLLVADGDAQCDLIRSNYPRLVGSPCDVMDSQNILDGVQPPSGHYDAILVTSEQQAVEVIRAVRKRYPQTDIIYGSSMQMLDREDQILNAGADTVLYRPIFRTTLFETYQALRLKRKSATGVDQYLAGKNILVAEDQPINYAVAAYILTHAGATVSRAENGKEAVARFLEGKPNQYDVILMDIMMPLMNGYEAAAAIRRSDRPDSHSIPIVAMTANAFSEDIQKAYQYGMNGHISKPLEPQVMRDKLIYVFSSQIR